MHAAVLNYFLIFCLSFLVSQIALASPGDLYLQTAIQKKLWTDPQWLRLGHYNPGGHSPFRGNLFVDEKGYDSPEKELIATLRAFFSESKYSNSRYGRPAQCQFLARRRWLSEKLSVAEPDLLPCDERMQWKKRINTKSISLIFASADLGNPASSYGHTFLKLVNPDNRGNKDLIDYGVNYAADGSTAEGFLYALKGLVGLYDGVFTMLPFHQKIRDYVNLEGRDLWEYPLNLSLEEVDLLIDHLLELDNSRAPYYFFTDNCSFEILKILEVVRPGLQLSKFFTAFVIPIDTVKVIERESSLITEREFKKSLKTDYVDAFSRLNHDQKNELEKVVGENKLSSPSTLNPRQKAEVLETATKYLAVKSYRTGKDLTNEIYQLSAERAVLGAITQERKIETTQAPDESHDSSAIYLGAGDKFFSFKFRSAFHDLEQPDFGTVHMSQTEMGAVDFRYDVSEKKLSLDRFTLLDLINMNPSNQLDQNLSWKVRMDVRDQWSPDIEAGGGVSYDVDLGEATRVGSFLTGRAGRDEFYGAGPEILILFRPWTSVGLSIDMTYFGVVKKQDFFRLRSKLNYNFAQNFDLQFEAESQFKEKTEYQVRAVKNFLF